MPASGRPRSRSKAVQTLNPAQPMQDVVIGASITHPLSLDWRKECVLEHPDNRHESSMPVLDCRNCHSGQGDEVFRLEDGLKERNQY